MLVWALIFMLLSGIVFVLGFAMQDLTWLFFYVYPVVGVIFSVTAYFTINKLKKNEDVTDYKQEVQKLRAELDRTRQRVADDMTKIEFPSGYKEKEALNLETTKIEFPEKYKNEDKK